MPNRITESFDRLRREKRKGLIPFVCGGHPTLDALPDILFALESAGATVIEIGIPFSDPIADGPVIAAAMHEALGNGVTPARLFDSVRAARTKGLEAPLATMVSISIVHRMGAERFITDAA
ncbi:MAG TPA: tryptophan synthase subunit alpha, partial [Phycisphaerales bacterium]|nr:tryptophan synthase subunit alpha [Phycisphaerales bacterium]